MQDDAARIGDHADGHLQQSLAQRRDLRAYAVCHGVEPEFLEQDVRGNGEQHAQLIGSEAAATRAIDLKAMMISLIRFSMSPR